MRRPLVVAALAVGVALVPSPASAHVVLERTEVAAGTTAELSFRAPVEQPGTTNRKIYALVPGPVAVDSCRVPSAAWTCTRDTTSRPGDTFVTWETPVAGSPQDLRFLFTVSVPASAKAQELKVPVVQTYSDGTVARWIDDGEPSPAPRLTVLAKGATPRTAAPTAPSHGGGAPASTSPGKPAVTAQPTGTPTAGSAPTATATTGSTATTPAATPPPSSGAVLSEGAPVAAESSSWVAPLAAVLAVLAGLGAAGWVLARRRRAA